MNHQSQLFALKWKLLMLSRIETAISQDLQSEALLKIRVELQGIGLTHWDIINNKASPTMNDLQYI